MLLESNFYAISQLEVKDLDVHAALTINASHKIFEGHFPQQPVVPGVCMMQMVKEIMEKVTEKKTNLLKANEMKFLAIINPVENNDISATLKYTIDADGNMTVTASLFKGELVHFKFKGQFAFQ